MRTRYWLLLALASLGLVISLLLIGSWLARADSQPAALPVALGQPWTGVAPPVLLSDASQRAVARAQEWEQDIRLVWLTASWRPTADRLQVFYPPVAWHFYYYSPVSESVASVGVWDQQLFWTSPKPLGEPLPELTPFPPPQGPDVAWISFRAAGGEQFLREHTGAEVQFRLRQAATGPVWVVSAFEPGVQFEVVVDGMTGVVLAAEGPPN